MAVNIFLKGPCPAEGAESGGLPGGAPRDPHMILEQEGGGSNICCGHWGPTGSTEPRPVSFSRCLIPFLKQKPPKAACGWQREDSSTWQGDGEEFTLPRPVPPFDPEASTAGAQKSSTLHAVCSFDLMSVWPINY